MGGALAPAPRFVLGSSADAGQLEGTSVPGRVARKCHQSDRGLHPGKTMNCVVS